MYLYKLYLIMRKIVIDLIMSNICNKRCNYCCIKFNWKIIKSNNIDFLLDYLYKYSNDYDTCLVNFFWWEPLLNYKNIVYFIENNKNDKISYSIWTNGFLLKEDVLDLFIKNNVKIYLSFHSDKDDSYNILLEKKYLIKYINNIEINFIVSPLNLIKCYEKLEKTLFFWYKKINIIPVMLTQKWGIDNIKELKSFIDYVDKNYIDNNEYKDVIISKYSFFDWISDDKTFVIDYDLNIYQDSSDEIYIWKQFDLLWEDLINEFQSKSFLWNIKNNELSYFLKKHSPNEIIDLVYKMPKKMNYIRDYYLIHKIMNKNNKFNRMWSNIIF